jgi:zinc/manganese transport system permease protein
MSAHALIVEPFETLGFMRAALVACLALALANGAVGTLLVLRRMSFDGDALGHAVMPGAAVGFLYAGHRRRGCRWAGWRADLPWRRWPG